MLPRNFAIGKLCDTEPENIAREAEADSPASYGAWWQVQNPTGLSCEPRNVQP